MKAIKSVVRSVALSGVLLAAAQSWGYTIGSGSIDVGGLDSLMGWTDQLGNSNPITETNWVNSFLNPDTTFTMKTETVSYQEVDGGGAWTFALQADPGFYLIKNATFWALFRNEESLDWAVFDAHLLPSGINLGGEGQLTISHVSEFGGSTPVPEPGSISLLAVGMLGLVAVRRLVKKY